MPGEQRAGPAAGSVSEQVIRHHRREPAGLLTEESRQGRLGSVSPSSRIEKQARTKTDSRLSSNPRTVGSSPRLRGTGQGPMAQGVPIRFIPAPAGNRGQGVRSQSNRSVHPRTCGEQEHQLFGGPPSPGSSPRLRGTGFAGSSGHSRSRFIPAPAGNRPASVVASTVATVHPRACGEQGMGKTVVMMTVGSSPRLRGTGPHRGGSSTPPRFIPAPAGNRFCFPLCRGLPPVHPRACGEQDSTPNLVAT